MACHALSTSSHGTTTCVHGLQICMQGCCEVSYQICMASVHGLQICVVAAAQACVVGVCGGCTACWHGLKTMICGNTWSNVSNGNAHGHMACHALSTSSHGTTACVHGLQICMQGCCEVSYQICM